MSICRPLSTSRSRSSCRNCCMPALAAVSPILLYSSAARFTMSMVVTPFSMCPFRLAVPIWVMPMSWAQAIDCVCLVRSSFSAKWALGHLSPWSSRIFLVCFPSVRLANSEYPGEQSSSIPTPRSAMSLQRPARSPSLDSLAVRIGLASDGQPERVRAKSLPRPWQQPGNCGAGSRILQERST